MTKAASAPLAKNEATLPPDGQIRFETGGPDRRRLSRSQSVNLFLSQKAAPETAATLRRVSRWPLSHIR